MNLSWLTTNDCPVGALLGQAAKVSAVCATSSTLVNCASTVSLSITVRITSSSLIPNT